MPPVGEPNPPPVEVFERPFDEIAEPVETAASQATAPDLDSAVAHAAEAAVPQQAEEPALVSVAAQTKVAAEQAPIAAEATVAAKPLRDTMQALVEKSIIDSHAKFNQAKTVAEEASAAVEASFDAARDGLVALNAKSLEAIKAGADANFGFALSFASAKTASELLALQSEFARKHFEEASSQAKAMTELARKVADETIAPLKAHVSKTFKIAV